MPPAHPTPPPPLPPPSTENSDAVIRYIAQLYAGDYNWRRLFNMNPSLGDPDLIFTNNNRLVVGSLCVSSQTPLT
jgi:hypothetical protein